MQHSTCRNATAGAAKRPVSAQWLGLLISLTIGCGAWLSSARAVIPEPDNVLYGTIVLDGQLVTAARTDVVIEARRTVSGPPIASYRMGSTATLGDLYSLRVSLESGVPVVSPDGSQAGDSVVIVVQDASGLRAQATYTVAERGNVQRLDFGAVSPGGDSDGDGLPDAWELARVGTTSQGAGALGLNGQTLLANYTAGTDPNDTNSVFRVEMTYSNAQPRVSFLARQAEGTGYENRTRLFTLETSSDVGPGVWSSVQGMSDIVGANQDIEYFPPPTDTRRFYRARVRLAP